MEFADFFRAVAALLVTLGLVFGAFYLMRRYGLLRALVPGTAEPGTRHIRLLERQSLGPNRSFVVVRWGDSDHLIAMGPAFCTLIASQGIVEASATSGKVAPKPDPTDPAA